MRFLTISDTHVRGTSVSDHGWFLLHKARSIVQEGGVDLVLFGGDLAEPGTGMLDPSLDLLASFGVPVLWVVGNNDLEALETTHLSDYERDAQHRASLAGANIHVLDASPFVQDGVAFIGNYGGYDGSLYHQPWAPRAHDLLNQLCEIHLDAGLDRMPLHLFQQCQDRLKQDLLSMPWVMPKVVCTHTVPDGRFLKYGHSTKFDDLNVAMGWHDTFIATTHELRYQFCGHTHRSQTVERDGLPPIINISGADQPRLFSL